MYKAIKSFRDLQDNNYRYHAGDIFPRKGAKVSDERIAELSTSSNRKGEPVIVEVLEETPIETAVVNEEIKEKPAPKKKSSGRKKTNAK